MRAVNLKPSRKLLPLASLALLGAVFLVGAGTPPAVGFSTGPLPYKTGAPGDTTCLDCHNYPVVPLNGGGATFALTSPQMYLPNTQNTIGITFGNTTTPRHGFEITARNGNDMFAGAWSVLLTGKTQNAQGAPAYHEHTINGIGQSNWVVNWTAPATLPPGPVIFYAAGNEADGDFTNNGDHIYTAVTKMYQATLLPQTSNIWPLGSYQPIFINAPGHAGELFAIAASTDPTPFSFGAPYVIEVNPINDLTDYAWNYPQTFVNFIGGLNANGQAQAGVGIPPQPSLAGYTAHFAAATAVASGSTIVPTEVTNRFTITLQ